MKGGEKGDEINLRAADFIGGIDMKTIKIELPDITITIKNEELAHSVMSYDADELNEEIDRLIKRNAKIKDDLQALKNAAEPF